MGTALNQVTRGAHYLLTCIQINYFYYDFHIFKMVDNYFNVQSLQIYKFGKNSYWLNITFNKQCYKYSLVITLKFTYIKDGETKNGFCTTF